MIWFIVSWLLVFVLTGVNVYAFLKLKQLGDQAMQMMGGMSGMMGAMPRGGRGGSPFGGRPGAPAGGQQDMQAQLKAAMDMLQKMQQKKR